MSNNNDTIETAAIKFLPDATLTKLHEAFPADVVSLMPPQSEIPDEFRRRSNRWHKLFSDWFYFGLSDLKLTPKEGIDHDQALRHIRCIMGSFQLKHEHKEAACAYLFDSWFSDVKYTRKEREL